MLRIEDIWEAMPMRNWASAGPKRFTLRLATVSEPMRLFLPGKRGNHERPQPCQSS